jgi:hypothetical protein
MEDSKIPARSCLESFGEAKGSFVIGQFQFSLGEVTPSLGPYEKGVSRNLPEEITTDPELKSCFYENNVTGYKRGNPSALRG